MSDGLHLATQAQIDAMQAAHLAAWDRDQTKLEYDSVLAELDTLRPLFQRVLVAPNDGRKVLAKLNTLAGTGSIELMTPREVHRRNFMGLVNFICGLADSSETLELLYEVLTPVLLGAEATRQQKSRAQLEEEANE